MRSNLHRGAVAIVFPDNTNLAASVSPLYSVNSFLWNIFLELGPSITFLLL